MPAKPQTPFGDHLDKLLAARGLSVREFARMQGIGVSSVSAAKRRRVKPRRIEEWVALLGLKGGERELFVELAWLTHAPEYVLRLIANQRREIERLRALKRK